MAEQTPIAQATADDVTYFARRRFADEHSRALYADLAQSAPNGALVAKDEGTPIGIAIAHALEDEWFLSELFVEPSFRAAGIGAELLREAARDAGDVIRTGLLRAEEHAALAFFLQRGVAIQMPVLRVSGAVPHENELMRMAAGEYRFGTEPLDLMRHRAPLAQLDRELRGTSRPLDHQYFMQNSRGFVFTRESELAGYAYVWPSGRIGPFAAASQSYLVQMLSFVLAALRQTYGASWCSLLVPGTNVRVMRAAMRAGLTIEALHLYASDANLADLSRYTGFHELLF